MASAMCCLSTLVALVAVVCGLALYMFPAQIQCTDNQAQCVANAISLLPDDGVDYCKLSGDGKLNTADLNTKGYTVAKDWMHKEMREKLLAIRESLGDEKGAATGKNGGSTPGYRLPVMFGRDIFKEVPDLAKLLHSAVSLVEKETDISITMQEKYMRDAIFFHTNVSESNSMMFGWHQDTENFFLFNNLYHYLDFYIMLDKPDPNAAGVMMVPFDVLKARAPRLYEKTAKSKSNTKGAGVFSFIAEHGITMYTESYDDSQTALNFTMDEISCTPTLAAGDLLLFRGDAIHRTQPHQTYRTSLNVNVHRPCWLDLSLWDTLSGSLWKFGWMSMAPQQYGILHGNPPGFEQAVYAGYLLRKGLSGVRSGLTMMGV